MINPTIFKPQIADGTLRIGKIAGYDLLRGLVKIQFSSVNEQFQRHEEQVVNIPIPTAFYSNDGLFIGAKARKDTQVVLAYSEVGWQFVSFYANINDKTDVFKELEDGKLLIRSTNLAKITLDKSSNINIGSTADRFHIDLANRLYSSSFNSSFSFTEASRQISGVIKREINTLNDYPDSLKLTNDNYYISMDGVSLDPLSSPSVSFANKTRNPAFVEQRELVYEFAKSYDVRNDLQESVLYSGDLSKISLEKKTTRDDVRSNVLSLGTNNPNYLIETIKGTVVDIFGQVLDINRYPIQISNLSFKDNKDTDKTSNFIKLKEAHRKGIAFHFELNAKKDLTGNNGKLNLPDINSKTDYARNRSRFFIDIDKEGLFKINIPASSETGNIPLLTRYENYSTFGEITEDNANKLFVSGDNKQDIYLDSFAAKARGVDGALSGDILLKYDDGYQSPIDRLDLNHILHGTPYHSIRNNTLYAFQDGLAQLFLDFEYTNKLGLTDLPTIKDVVSSKIQAAGSNANAGGRSGSINLDGSLEMSIGANTIDRQSLWLDTAGGVLANLGRDKNNVSAGFTLDGDLLVQIGGYGVDSDSRFSAKNNYNNDFIQGTFDIRVLNSGYTVSIIRIDKNGITVATPGELRLKGRSVNISAEGDMVLTADNVSINERLVNKLVGGSI